MINIWSKVRRPLYGLFAVLIVLGLSDFLPPILPFGPYRLFDYFYLLPGVEAGLITGVAALAGAYTAKVRFVLPSALLAAIWWSVQIRFLNSIDVGTGPGDLRTVAATNIFSLGFAVLGAIAGSLLGQRLATRRLDEVANPA